MKKSFYKNGNLVGLATLVFTVSIFLLLLLSRWDNRTYEEIIVYTEETKLYYPIVYSRYTTQTETLVKQIIERV